MASKEIERLKVAVETVRKSNERLKPAVPSGDQVEAAGELVGGSRAEPGDAAS